MIRARQLTRVTPLLEGVLSRVTGARQNAGKKESLQVHRKY